MRTLENAVFECTHNEICPKSAMRTFGASEIATR